MKSWVQIPLPRPLFFLTLLCLLGACGGDEAPDPSDVVIYEVSKETNGTISCPSTTQVLSRAVSTDSSTGLSGLISFTLPTDTVSFLAVVQGDSDIWYTTDLLTSPDGTVLVPSGWHETASSALCLECKNRVSATPGLHSVFAPIQPQSAVLSGEWQLRIMALSGEFPSKGVASKVQVTVVAKLATHEPLNGTVNLALRFPKGGSISANDAQEDVEFQSQVDALAVIFDQVNIKLGQVRYIDGDFPSVLKMADVSSLWVESNASEEDISVMFVDELSSPSGMLRGLTTVPGAWRMDSVPGGCVVSTVSQPGDSKNALGAVIAHELGHYLGLFHTSEGPGLSIHDPLPDTPKGTKDNLMTVTLSTMELTEDQGRVMRLHPAVQHECK